MIASFKNKLTKQVAEGVISKATTKILPSELHKLAQAKLNILAAANDLQGLAIPGFNLEKMKDKRSGLYSIRINRQYRIYFAFNGIEFSEVEIVDYH